MQGKCRGGKCPTERGEKSGGECPGGEVGGKCPGEMSGYRHLDAPLTVFRRKISALLKSRINFHFSSQRSTNMALS